VKLSAKAEYGVRMMADLAAAYGHGPLPLSQVAERQGISVDFLEQLIGALRKKGLVESVRGARGGYRLAKPPQDITVGDVIYALEGPFVPMICLEVDHEHQPDCCSRLAFCTTRDVWVRLRDQVNATLTAISLADLVRPEADRPLAVVVPPGADDTPTVELAPLQTRARAAAARTTTRHEKVRRARQRTAGAGSPTFPVSRRSGVSHE
jgi:Rrf2 family protein